MPAKYLKNILKVIFTCLFGVFCFVLAYSMILEFGNPEWIAILGGSVSGIFSICWIYAYKEIIK
jgi:polyferredoxin